MKRSLHNPLLCFLRSAAFLLSFTIGASTSWAAQTDVSGTNSFSGTIDAGNSVRLLDTATLSGSVINNGLLDFSRSSAYSSSQVISGTGNVSISSTSTITFTGANTYTGATTVANVSGANAATPAYLKLSNTSGAAIQGNLVVGNNTTGIATVTMTRSNQFGANSVIIFNSTVNNWGYFNMNADQTVAGLSGTTGGGVIQVNQSGDATNYGARTLTVNVASGTSYTFSGYMRDQDSAGANSTLGLTKTGAGTQTLTGGQITYTGSTVVSAGTLGLTGAATISAFKSNSVSIASGATFKIDATGAGGSSSAATNYQGTAQFGQNATAANPLTLSGAGTFLVTGGTGDMLMLGNTPGSASGGVVIKFSAGGLIHVQGGTLRDGGYAATKWTDNQAGLQVDAGATFQLWDANTVRLDALTGGGTIANGLPNSGNHVLLLGVANGSGTFSGVINDNQSGISGGVTFITKTGTGTQVFSGTNNYTGTTTGSAGTLQFAKTSALYNSGTASWTAANIKIESGATAAFNVGGTGEFTSANIDTLKALGTGSSGFKAGSNIGLDTSSGNFSYASNIANTNSGTNALGLTKLGSNTLTLSGSNTYTGTTTVSAGTLKIADGSINNSSGIANAAELVFDQNTKAGSYGNIISGSGSLTKTGTNTLTLSGSNTYTGATTVTGGTLAVSGGGKLGASGSSDINIGGGALDLGATAQTVGAVSITAAATSGDTLMNGSLTGASYAASNATGNAIVSAALLANGTAGLTKTGAGTLTLSGSNTYTGVTTVSAGTLSIADGSINNSTGIANAAALVFDQNTKAGSYGNIISGSGSLTKTGTNTLTLSGSNTYTGTTTVTGGKLTLTGSLASATVNVESAAELVVNGRINTASTTTVNGILSGSGSLGAFTIKNGGTLSPGNSPGTLTADSASFENGSTFKLELKTGTVGGGVAGTDWDQLVVLNQLSLSGVITLDVQHYQGAWDGTVDHLYAGFITFGTITGFTAETFDLKLAPTLVTTSGVWSVVASGSNQLDLKYSAVPEPSAWAMLAGGMGMLLLGQRFRRRTR